MTIKCEILGILVYYWIKQPQQYRNTALNMELIALLLLAKTTTVEVVLNGAAVPVTVPLSLPPGEDASSFTPLAVATRFCAEHSISDGNCATMLAARLASEHYCGSPDALLRKQRASPSVRTFRFLTHALQLGDPKGELKLLRRVFLELGMVECPMALEFTGDEDALWVLGHVSGASAASFFNRLQPHQRLNSIPDTTDVGSKRNMQAHLVAFARSVGDAALRFVPRTWLAGGGVKGAAPPMRAAWVVKEPNKELAGGISIVNSWDDAHRCAECAVQRYVDDPLLLNGKKFSFGVYVTVASLDPLSVWVHDGEMLVLLSSVNYTEGEGGVGGGSELKGRTLLAHMTNGLLNKAINPEYDDEAFVWGAARLLRHLEARGIAWDEVRAQVHAVIATTMAATYESLVHSLHRAVPSRTHDALFTHWRFDFLLDTQLKVWLLECEIVPSAGTIGGPDEIIKLAVMRDMMRLNGLGAQRAAAAAEERKKEEWNAIRATLRAAGDALWIRDDAIATIARHRRHEAARGSYSCVIPFSAAMKRNPATATVVDAFYSEKAQPSDVVLRRWLRAEEVEAERLRSSTFTSPSPSPSTLGGRSSNAGPDISPGGAAVLERAHAEAEAAATNAAHATAGGVALAPAAARVACAACLRHPASQFCVTVTGFVTSLAPCPEPQLLAQCIPRKVGCIAALSEYVDGVGILVDAECALNERGLRSIVEQSHIGAVIKHASAARSWSSGY